MSKYSFKEKLRLRFKKSKCVRLRIYDNEHRSFDKIVIPKGGQVKLSEGLYTLSKDKFTIEGGIPTFTYVEDRPDPVDMVNVIDYDGSDAMTAQQVKSLIESNDLRTVMESAEGSTPFDIKMILSVVTILALIIGMYLMHQEIVAVQQTVQDLHQIYYPQTGGE